MRNKSIEHDDVICYATRTHRIPEYSQPIVRRFGIAWSAASFELLAYTCNCVHFWLY